MISKKIILKILIVILIQVLILILLSETPIRKGYMRYKLKGTQYEKLLWFQESIENKELYNRNFEYCFLGSSFTLYGINDSLIEKQTINLGMNTPSKEMELYLYKTLIENHNTVGVVFRENTKLSYGLHPVLHYVCTPSWLLKNGQQFFQPHFLNFVLKRAQIVFKSWVFFHKSENYNCRYTRFGFRSLEYTIDSSKFKKTQSLKEIKLNYNQFENWLHNFNSAYNFNKRILQKCRDQKSNIVYFSLPTPSRKYIIIKKNRRKVKWDIEYLRNNYYNWADPGHLNTKGAILFSNKIDSILKQNGVD
jgi:hypothetical protein